MMKVRKIAAALAAVSMLAAFSAQAVVAADAVTVNVDKVNADAGAEFTLTVELKGVPKAGINAADFALTYDASAITITDVTAGDIVKSSADDNFEGAAAFEADFSEAGVIAVLYGVVSEDSAYWVTADGTFLTISGKVNADTAEGTYPVKVEAVSRETYEGSGTPNTDIIISNMKSDGTITAYDVKTDAGAVIVGNPGPEDDKPGDGDSNLKGDANCDGVVDILDVITVNRAILGVESLTGQGLKNADLNGDGKPTSDESLSITKLIVGIVKEL